MPDTRTSGLGSAAAVTASDLFPVVDVEDTSMAGTGTTKKVPASTAALALSSLAGTSTLLALLNAKQERLIASMAGYFVITGADIVPSATPGKLDNATGYIGHLVSGLFFEKKVAAVTAIATKTITDLATDAGLAAGEAVWCSLEYDPAGVVVFNLGTKAAAEDAQIPSVVTGNVGKKVLYVPFGATTVSQSTSGTADAKLFDVGITQSVLPVRSVYAPTTFVALGNQTTLATIFDTHADHFPADSLRPGDVVSGVVSYYLLNPTGGTATAHESKLIFGGVTLIDITDSATSASAGSGFTANISRKEIDFDIEIISSISAKVRWCWRRQTTAAANAGEQTTAERYENLLNSTIATTGVINLDLQVRNTVSSATASHTLMAVSVTKRPTAL